MFRLLRGHEDVKIFFLKNVLILSAWVLDVSGTSSRSERRLPNVFHSFSNFIFFHLVKNSPNITYEILVKSIVKTYCISVLFLTPLVQEDAFLNDANTTAWVLTFLFQCKYI